MQNNKKQLLIENCAKKAFFFAAIISILSLIIICVFLLISGIPAIREIGLFKFLLGTTWNASGDIYGILPMIVGTIYLTAGALLISVPLGILTAVAIVFYAGKKGRPILEQSVNVLAGIPSIIYGFFGMVVIVPAAKELAYILDISGASGSGIFVGSIVLGLMVMPTIVNLSVAAIKSVPKNYYEGSEALGSSKERTILKVMLPAASGGIFTSIVLAAGRALGETMAMALVLGNSPNFPKSIFHSMENLTVAIVKEMSYAFEGTLHYNALLSIGLVLFVFILILSLSLRFISKGGAKK